MHRFTTEFGMGSGGSNALWSSSDSAGESLLDASPNWVCDRWFCSAYKFSAVAVFIETRKHQIVWVLYGQASRAISIG